MNKIFIFRIILLLVLPFIFTIKQGNYKFEYSLYPNYKEKYEEAINNYDLMKENYNFIPAQVVNLSSYKINNLFIINKGIKDNIIEGSYVVNEVGLVGIVEKSYNNFSIVKLITSNNISIPVEINDCYGTLKNKNNKSFVEDLINCENIINNSYVFTSKYSISSSNILVGKIYKIDNKKLFVKTSINPYKLKYVGVIYDSY